LETTSVRIVGFTASYLHGRLADPAGKLQRLQSNLHAEIWTPHDEDIAPFLPQQRFEPIFFSQSHLDCAIGQSKTESIIEQVLNGDAGVGLIRKPLQDISKKAGTIYHLLGRQAWLVFMTDGLCPLVRAKLEVRERAFDDESSKRKIRDAIAHLDKVQVYLNVLLRMLEEPEMQDTTDKVAVLMELLRTQSAEKPDFRCLLFTEMVASTYALAGLIRGVLPETNPLPVTGVGSMPDRIRKENLDKFNSGMSKILVATDSMEEGIDIQACNVVISFDKFHNIKSHIQRAGRARDASAAIFYFENDPDKAIRDASVMSGVARSATGPAAVADSINLDYIHPNTEAHVTPTNCFNILHEYVQKVLRKTVHTADIFTETDTGMVCRYPTPCGFTTLDSACLDAEDPSLSTFRAALQQERWNHQTSLQRWLAFLAVSRLIREGFIGEDNMPTARALETDPCSDVFGFASHERAGTSSVETSSTAPRGSGRAVGVHPETEIHQAINPKSRLSETLQKVLRPHCTMSEGLEVRRIRLRLAPGSLLTCRLRHWALQATRDIGRHCLCHPSLFRRLRLHRHTHSTTADGKCLLARGQCGGRSLSR